MLIADVLKKSSKHIIIKKEVLFFSNQAKQNNVQQDRISWVLFVCFAFSLSLYRQLRTANADIKVPSVENPELKGSPFRTFSRSGYSQA